MVKADAEKFFPTVAGMRRGIGKHEGGISVWTCDHKAVTEVREFDNAGYDIVSQLMRWRML